MAASVAADAPAKVNLTLEVIRRRADAYHDIVSVLQTLALADRVTLHLDSESPRISAIGPFAEGVPLDDTNLAWRAASLILPPKRLQALHIALDKRIPAAGGLGGGASDAATVLRLLQRLDPGLSNERLVEMANALGSDEAALVVGGTVLIEGRGDLVRPLPALAAHDVVLFLPGQTIPNKTGQMFAALEPKQFANGNVTRQFVDEPPAAFGSADVHNTFELVAFDMFPGLADLWGELETSISQPVRLAGAGPTMFWIGPRGSGERIAGLAAGAACSIVTTTTANSLWKR